MRKIDLSTAFIVALVASFAWHYYFGADQNKVFVTVIGIFMAYRVWDGLSSLSAIPDKLDERNRRGNMSVQD